MSADELLKFNPVAVSRAGAAGLMQLMPDVARALGADDPWDPRQNIMAGARLLRELLDRHHGNLALRTRQRIKVPL